MFRKSLLGMLVVAAGVGAGLAVKLLKDQKEDNEPFEDEDDDDEIHFIKIDDGEDEDDGLDLPAFDASMKSEPVQELSAVYPYLDPDFIEQELDCNTVYNGQFEEDALVTIQHRVVVSEDKKQAYVNLLLDAGYECVEEDDKLLVQRKFFYQDGAIVSDVLNIANLTSAAGAEYQGYEVK